MTSPDPKRVEEIFSGAIEQPPGERAAYLEEACAGDAGLRREVDDLLAHDEQASTRFLGGRGDAPDFAPGEHVGDIVGRYRLDAVIGEGGFGVVYRAHQSAPVERDVALKIIKVGMDTRRVVARFEMERQTLAQFSHPNTTRVLDAGSTDRGRPYFVMELVEGEPITKYCERNHLSVEDRLSLFLQTCAAVQHAHQSAIIHRDIKPSNVLVERIDGEPSVKVIDFGIARALDQDDSPQSMVTLRGAVIGTPEYMSPEQAAGEALDTRTDVYSLGVLLYELLAGAHPFAEQLSKSHDVTERLRLVREVDPPRPSTRMGGEDSDAAPDSSKGRRRALRGDLDWIVMRALEKDPARRYASVGELADDLRRHQNNEPVVAGPPGRAYRMKKFVRRHRVGVVAGSFVAAALALGMVGLFVGLAQARIEAERARREATRATQVATLLKDLFEGVNPAVTRGREAPVLREILAAASERIEHSLADEPLVEAELRGTIGQTQIAIGEFDAARANFRIAHQVRLAKLGAEHPDTLSAARGVASAMNYLGLHDDAAAFLENALAPWRRSRNRVAGDISAELHSLASIYREQGKYESAMATMRESLEARIASDGPEAPTTLRVRHDIAAMHTRLEQYEQAEQLHREVYETRLEALGEDHPDTLYSMNSLAYLYGSLGRFEESEPFYRKTLEGRRRVLGESHPETLTSINNLAFLYARMGRLSEAEALFLEALEKQKTQLGAAHPLTLLSMNNIGTVLSMQGRHDEASPFLIDAYEGRRETLGADHHYTLFSAHRFGENRRDMGLMAEAADYFRIAAEGRRRTLGLTHADTLASIEGYAKALVQQDRREESEGLIRSYILALSAEKGDVSSARDRFELMLGAIATETAKSIGGSERD